VTAYAALTAGIIREDVELAGQRRASLAAWIADCDRILHGLEDANAAGSARLSDGAQASLVDLARRLTALGAEARPFWMFRPGQANGVQRAVDYVFDALQPAAFRLKWPGLAEAGDGVVEPEEDDG